MAKRFERPASQLFRVLGAAVATGVIDQVDDPDGCWLWDAAPFYGPVASDGYGYIADRRHGRVGAHAVAWRWANKVRVPEGCEVDHVCRQRSCVNPRHLQAVDRYGNSARQSLTAAQHRSLSYPPIPRAAEGRSGL